MPGKMEVFDETEGAVIKDDINARYEAYIRHRNRKEPKPKKILWHYFVSFACGNFISNDTLELNGQVLTDKNMVELEEFVKEKNKLPESPVFLSVNFLGTSERS